MKFKLWTNPASSKTFVFVGPVLYKKHKKLLKKLEDNKPLTKAEEDALSEDLPKQQWKGEKSLLFMDKTIHNDDTIGLVLKRLCVYLQSHLDDSLPDDLYMWITQKVVKSPGLIANFVSNLFQNSKLIPFAEFRSATESYFSGLKLTETDFNLVDKALAFNLLMKQEINEITSSLQFKYTFNNFFKFVQYNPLITSETIDTNGFSKNSHYALTLQYFGKTECINFVLYKDFKHMPWLFPFHTGKGSLGEIVDAIESLDQIEESLNIDTSDVDHTGHITYLQFKFNETNFNRKVDLGKAFDRLSTSQELPFIKYRVYTNVYYKVDKDFIKDFDNYSEHWTKWTELTGFGRKYPENTSIIFKIKYSNDTFCSFRLYDNFVYDVKFAIGKAKKTTLSQIYKFCDDKINSLLKELRGLYPDSYVPDIDIKGITITQVTAVDFVSLKKKTIKYDNFREVLEGVLNPFFNIIPTKEKNVMHLQYKKVDNYLKYDNITAFVLQRMSMPKDDLIKELAKWFNLSQADAQKEYEKVSSKIEMEANKEGEKVTWKTKMDGFVNVKIKLLSPVDMEFEVSGYKYLETHDRIVELMQMLAKMTHMKIDIEGIDMNKLEKALIDDKKDDGIKMNDVNEDDIAEQDVDTEFLNQDEKVEFAQAIGEPILENDIDQDFLDIVGEVVKDAPDLEGAENIPEDEDLADEKKRVGYFFKKLKDADKDLFTYTTKHIVKDDKNKKKARKDYSTLCSGRYPVVINKHQKDNIDQTFPGSYNGYLKVGSTAELAQKNYYICPEVWCPKSMISMTKKQFEEAEKKCPFEGEQPIQLTHSYWGNDPKTKRYVGVLDPYIHPKDFCLPCCFKKEMTKGQNKENLDICKKRKPELIYINKDENSPIKKEEVIAEFDEEQAFIGNPKYIKGEFNWPLHAGHYGLLPEEIRDLLGGKKCGDRPDGTGNMSIETECFLRRGSSNKDQSFLACMVEILENEDIRSVSDVYKVLKDGLTLERFLSLENGKILKVFINERFNIFDPSHFGEFVKWFLDKKHYVLKMNQGKVYRALESLKTPVFSKEIRHYKDVIREFMVYNAYKHFLEHLASNNPKDHRALIDLFNCEREILNPKNINIVVLEITSGKVVVQCPFNRSGDAVFNKRHPFAFLLWNGRYYEFLTRLRYSKENGMETRVAFFYIHSSPEMRSLIDFVCNNCLEKSAVPETVLANIEVTTGLKTKFLVLDYGFRIKGVLLSQNIYVPLENKISMYGLLKKRFVYYSDIVNYKCVGDAKKALTSLAKKNPFYKIESANDRYIKLSSGKIVPLNISKKDVEYKVFEDDLEIFVGHQRKDPRENILSVVNENKKIFSVFLNSVITYINANKDIRKEVDFLTDFKNPFPTNFKRAKLMKILSSIVDQVLIVPDSAESKEIVDSSKDAVIPCPDLDWDKCLVGIPKDSVEKFKHKIQEQLLINNSFYFDSKTKIFSHAPTEFLFEHHEIVVGKHKEYIKHLQDPFKILTERLDEEFGEYMFTSQGDPDDYLQEFIGEDCEFKNNYDKFKTTLRNAFVVDVEESYNNMYMYQWFEVLYKTLRQDKSVDALYLKSFVKNSMINDYESPDFSAFLENASFEALWEKYKKTNKQETVMQTKPSLDLCEKFFGSTQYYISMYELKVLSDFVNVNVIIFTRLKKTNRTGIEFIDNRSSHYILMYHKFDSLNKRNIYEIIVVDQKRRKALFNKTDLDNVMKLAKLKDVMIEIDVPDELLQAFESN